MTARALIALGSPHGLDRIAWDVLERLRQSDSAYPTFSGWHMQCCAAPVLLPGMVQGAERVLLLDACTQLDAALRRPQAVAVADLDRSGGNSHDLALSQVLALCGQLAPHPIRFDVYAIPMGNWNPGESAYRQRVDSLAEALPALLQSQAVAIS